MLVRAQIRHRLGLTKGDEVEVTKLLARPQAPRERAPVTKT
jgi:hypothetical protein